MKKKTITEASASHHPDSNAKVSLKWKLAAEPLQSEGGRKEKRRKRAHLRFSKVGRQADSSVENPLPPAWHLNLIRQITLTPRCWSLEKMLPPTRKITENGPRTRAPISRGWKVRWPRDRGGPQGTALSRPREGSLGASTQGFRGIPEETRPLGAPGPPSPCPPSGAPRPPPGTYRSRAGARGHDGRQLLALRLLLLPFPLIHRRRRGGRGHPIRLAHVGQGGGSARRRRWPGCV